jgi:hypothetical protein
VTYGEAEFGFELLACRWAELAWPPEERRDSAVVVSRQLGTQKRRWDTVVVEADPDALVARRQFGTDALDSDLLHVVRNAPEDWAWYRDALPHPGYPWRYVLEAVHRAAARGVVEKRRNGNKIEIRRIAAYPDWVERIVAVEHKPDLDASAARALHDQLEHDVETALADEVWVATAATGSAVEPALLESMPVEVGILTLDFSDGVHADAGDVAWYPSSLDPTVGGERFSADEKAEKRLAIAERAYGKGWRSFYDTMRPDCRQFELRREGQALVPWCAVKERGQTAAECAGSCPEFTPEPPQWRMKGWPIEGGPGKGVKQLLERRREWVRERETSGTAGSQ